MNALITESLLKKDTSYVLPFKRVLLSKTEVKWVAWIHQYTLKFGQPPTLERFEKEFPSDFVRVPSADPLQDIYEQTLQEKRNVYARAEITKHAQNLKDGENPIPLIEKIHDAITANDEGCVTTEFFDKSDYFKPQQAFMTGISNLDALVGGFVKGDLAWIVGRPGDGKTTLLLFLIAKWFWEGKTILMISNEIPYKDMLFKIDAISANMKVWEKRLGKWEPDSKEKIRFLQYVQSISPGKIIVPTGPVRQPSSLSGMIKQYKPDIVCIDGAYMMSPTGSVTTEWAELAQVSRELKQIANTTETPIIGVLQATRDSEFKSTMSLSAIAGTDAFGQDADTVLFLKSNGIANGDKVVVCHTSKNRNGIMGSAMLAYDFNRMVLYETNED